MDTGKWTQAFSGARTDAASKSSSRDPATQLRPSNLPQFLRLLQISPLLISGDQGEISLFRGSTLPQILSMAKNFFSLVLYAAQIILRYTSTFFRYRYMVEINNVEICLWMHKMARASLLQLSDRTNMP